MGCRVGRIYLAILHRALFPSVCFFLALGGQLERLAMAHKYYPNLAHLETFDRDLDYSGIPLEGWAHPSCLIPPVLLTVALLTAGFPRGGIVSLWVLFNFAIIHPMDL